RAERDDAAVRGHTVDNRAHAVLADAEVDVAARVAPAAAGLTLRLELVERRIAEVASALHCRVGRRVEVRRAADEGRDVLEEGIDDLSGRLAGGDRLVARLPARETGVPALGQVAVDRGLQLRGEIRIRLAIAGEELVPGLLGLRALVDRLSEVRGS